jgi:DNA-binding NarL/FixJ family response regulator
MITSLREAQKMIEIKKPNILLIDLDLFEEGGDLKKVTDFIAELSKNYPKLTILVLSAMSYIRVDVVRSIVSTGASYLIKEAIQNPEHLNRAIQHARTGGAVYDRHLVKLFDQVVTGKSSSLLTPREWQVAALIGEKGLTNREIGQKLGLTSNRIGELVSSILDKRKFSSRTQIATWYVEQQRLGLVDPDLIEPSSLGSNKNSANDK